MGNMNISDWLSDYDYEYGNLPAEDRKAIGDFLLLWTIFEGRLLNSEGSPKTILSAAKSWAQQPGIRYTQFDNHLEYFISRYSPIGWERFERALHLRNNDHKQLLRNVLFENGNNSVNRFVALLTIVYRLGNNLFHGLKWSEGVYGQKSNFEHATETMMKCLKHFKDYPLPAKG